MNTKSKENKLIKACKRCDLKQVEVKRIEGNYLGHPGNFHLKYMRNYEKLPEVACYCA